MLLERTIAQLDLGHMPQAQADHMGQLGYLQWLGGLDGNAGYAKEALRAYQLAQPFAATSPAVAVFCHLLITSVTTPLEPLDINPVSRARRGGAKARRHQM